MTVGRKPWCGVYRAAGIGDLLIVSSAVAQLAKNFNVEVLCDAPYGTVWEHNPYVAKLTEIPKDTLPKEHEQWRNWFRMRAREYEAFYDLSQTCEVTLALASGQVAFDWPASARRKLCGRSYLEWVHDVCELPYDFDPGPRFYASEAERADAQRVKGTVGSRMIGIPVSGSRIDKTWPWMPQLVAKILRELKVPVVLFGGSTPRDVAIADRTHEAVVAAVGDRKIVDELLHCCISKDTKEVSVEWSMRRNMAQLQACDLVITPDTGLAWAVAMEPMPKIVLLSHASPENITKHWRNTVTLHADQERVPCWPCHRLHDSPDTCVKAEKADAAACMTDIHDEIVLEHVRKALERFKPLVSEISNTTVAPWTKGTDRPWHDGQGGNALGGETVTFEGTEGYVGLRRTENAA
jgi:ADP-heptose:LPS heptosyltransferase